MDKSKISVIVPVYNVERYLPECIDSIRNQTYHNLEIILVDDGSTDSSGDICEDYAKKDERIRVVHKENGGQGTARNLGLDLARGDYITFVDSDDSIEQNMYQMMMDILNETEADLVGSSFYDDYGDEKVSNGDTGEISVFSGENIFLNREKLRLLVWNKVYKKEIIGDTRFVPGQVYEEVHFNAPIFFGAKKVAYYDAPLYNYRNARVGNTNSSFKLGRMCIFKEFDSIMEELEKREYFEAKESMILYYLSFYRRLYKEAYSFGVETHIKKEIRSNFLKYYKKARKLHVKLDKGSYVFCTFPNLLSHRDLLKQRRMDRKKSM